MKRGPGFGKTFKLAHEYSKVKFEASTVNTKPLKSIQIETRFWFNKEKENPAGHINKIFRECKQLIYAQSKFYDKDKLISVADYPKDFNCPNPNIFVNFEFTIFPNIEFANEFDISQYLTELTDKLHGQIFDVRDDVFKSKMG